MNKKYLNNNNFLMIKSWLINCLLAKWVAENVAQQTNKSKIQPTNDQEINQSRSYFWVDLKKTYCFISTIIFYFYLSPITLAQTASDSIVQQYLSEANLLVKQKKEQQAINIAQQAANIAHANQNWAQCFKAYKIICLTYHRQKKEKEAFEYIEQVIKAIPEQHHLRGKCYYLKAWLYKKILYFDKAATWYEKSIVVLEQQLFDVLLYKAYNELAIIYTRKGAYQKAITYLQQVINKSIENKDSTYLVKAYSNMGIAYLFQGNPEKGIDFLDKTLPFYKQDPHKTAFIWWRKAQAYLAQKNYAQAIAFCQKAIASKAYKDKDLVYVTLGNVFAETNDLQKAQQAYQKALELVPQYDRNAIAKIYVYMGDVYQTQQDYGKALTHYQQTLHHLIPNFNDNKPTKNPNLAQLPPTSLWVMEALAKKGQTFYAQYEQNGQGSSLLNAYDAYQLVTNYIQQIKVNYSEEESQRLLTDYTHNFYEQAIQTSLSLWQTTQNSKYQQQTFQWMQQNKAFELRSNLKEKEALKLVGISSAERDTAQQLQLAVAHVQKEIYDIKQDAAWTNLDSLNDVRFNLKRKQEELQATWKDKYPQYNRYTNDFHSLTTSKLQQNIDHTTALIEYFVGDATIYTCVLTKNEVQFYQLPIPESFDTTFQQFRKSISDWQFVQDSAQLAEQFFLKPAHQLYLWLLAEPLQHLPLPINRLLIIPDGVLGYIPFGTLLSQAFEDWQSKDMPYLLKEYAISYAYSSTLLTQSTTTSTNVSSTVGGFGLAYDAFTLQALAKHANSNPAFKTTVPQEFMASITRGNVVTQLPHAPKEVDFVVNLFGGKKWVNQDATKENFLAHAADYGILHLAMHGILNEENPLYSALIFNKSVDTLDNFLYASDLYNTNLNAGLAVLSACNTGYGRLAKGEGIMSLSRAFSFAGCPSTVMSLWSIPDQATKQIVASFYQQLWIGITKDQALQRAKLDYLKQINPQNRLPIYWAALVGIGDRQPIVKRKWVKCGTQSPKSFPWFLVMSAIVLIGLITCLWIKKK